MTRKRVLQVVLVLCGLLFTAAVYPLVLFSRQQPPLAMMLSLYVPMGLFLLLAARNPSEHRSLILYAACANIAHAAVMGVQGKEGLTHHPQIRQSRRDDPQENCYHCLDHQTLPSPDLALGLFVSVARVFAGVVLTSAITEALCNKFRTGVLSALLRSTPMALQPLTCPVCRQTATARLLQEVRITAEVKGAVRDVNAVGAFVCQEKGHIFLVRFADIEWAEAATETA